MAEPARTTDDRGCPRVIGPSGDGKHLITCGHTEPCPIHGAARVRVVEPTHDNGGEGSE